MLNRQTHARRRRPVLFRSKPEVPVGFAPPPVFVVLEHTAAERSKHPVVTVALHWGTVAAIVIAVAAMFLRDAIEDKFWRQLLLETHRQLGLLVLIGVGVRIAVRMWHGFADHAPDMRAIVRWAAKATHVLLYGLLIALPLEGWALTNAHGITLALLGTVHLPNLLASDSELADTLSDYHIWLAWGLLIFVGMHAVAALWHHFVRRDSVLTAMLPRRRTRSSAFR
jgi:cytochrome b561